MATIYFSSPIMQRNRKVEAVAGKRTTLLGVAKENNIKIPFECEDGECGSCLVKITHLDGERVKGIMLTDKEVHVLKSIGRISKHEEERANLKDLPLGGVQRPVPHRSVCARRSPGPGVSCAGASS